MSNDPSNNQTPNLETESMSIEDRQSPESNGRRDGDLWVRDRAGSIELEHLLECSRGPTPDLRQCRDSDQAILECVRVLLPPCALHLDSARGYWRLVLESERRYSDQVPFVAGFLEAAVDGARAVVTEAGEKAAEEWIEHRARPDELANAARFAELHGDTWETDFPVARGELTTVAVRMIHGEHRPPESDSPDDDESWAVFLVITALSLGIIVGWTRTTFCPDEFTKAFIRRVVAIIRERQAEGSRITDGQPGEIDDDSAGEAEPQPETPQERQRRSMGLRAWRRTVRKPKDGETRPEGPEEA